MPRMWCVAAVCLALSAANAAILERPPKAPFADTLENVREEREEGSKLFTQLVQKYEGQACESHLRVKISRKSMRFSRSATTQSVLQHLITEYCGYAEKMKDLKLGVPLYVEVGTGTKTVYIDEALSKGCRVKVFEPSTAAFEKLEKYRAGKPDNVREHLELHKTAVAHKAGPMEFHEGKTGRTQGSNGLVGASTQVEPGKWWHSTAEATTKTVETVPLANALGGEQLLPVMYIDAHGWELRVLEGAMELLDTHKAQAVVFRLWPTGMRDAHGGEFPAEQLKAVLRRLRWRGYYLYRAQAQSLHLRDLPELPECLDHLLEALDYSSSFDAFGVWVDLVLVKTGLL